MNLQKTIKELLQPENERTIKKATKSTYLLYKAEIPAVIVECAFVDNATDVEILATESKRKSMGQAIAKGILKTLGVEIQSEVLYRVQVGAYSNKSNAEAMLKKLKSAGFTGYIKQG